MIWVINKKFLLTAGVIVVLLLLILIISWLWPVKNTDQESVVATSGEIFPTGGSQIIPTTDKSTTNDISQTVVDDIIINNLPSVDSAINFSLIGSRFKNLVAEPVTSAAWLPDSENELVYLDQARKLAISRGKISGH